MSKNRNHYTPEEKVSIICQHLIEKVAVADICQERRSAGWETGGHQVGFALGASSESERAKAPGGLHSGAFGVRFEGVSFSISAFIHGR